MKIITHCKFVPVPTTATSLKAQNPKLTLDLTKPGANVSPQL